MADISVNGSQNLVGAIGKLGAHDHLCLIYETQEEQFSAVIPYMKIGLERGEKCFYVVDDNTAEIVINRMKTAGIAVESAVASGGLAIVSKQESYLKQGYFDPDWMIGFLKQATDEAKAAGYTALRITGEMTWVLGGDPGTERLLEYEAKLNYFFPANDALAICQYNRTRFSPEIVKSVLSTHPLVIFGGRVCKNFYYVSPDELLGKDRPAKELTRLLANITSREMVEEELRRNQERFEKLARERTAETEKAVHEQQQVFRTLVENSPDIIARYDRDCKRTYVNPTYLKVAQIASQDLISSAPLQRSPLTAASAANLQSTLRKVLDNGIAEVVDVIWPKAGQGDTWYNIYAYPEFDREGRVASVMTVARDISSRKCAEEELSRMNERFGLAVSAARLGVWDWDIGKNELLWDDMMYTLYGIRKEDFSGAYEAWLQGVHPDDREHSNEISKRAQRGEQEYDTEFRVVWPDNSIHWLKAYGRIVRDRAGNPVRMTGVNFDITDRKSAEESLRRSEEKYRRLIETVQEGIWVIDKESITTFVNPRMAELLGYAPGEMLGKPLFGFMDEQGKRIAEYNVERRKQGIKEQHDFEFIRKDGERIYTSLETGPIIDEARQYAGAIAAVADITERRKAEEALSRLNEELEQRVKDRTKDLERRNYELEQMNKAFVGRELKMVELKERIKELERKTAGK